MTNTKDRYVNLMWEDGAMVHLAAEGASELEALEHLKAHYDADRSLDERSYAMTVVVYDVYRVLRTINLRNDIANHLIDRFQMEEQEREDRTRYGSYEQQRDSQYLTGRL